MAGEGRGAKLRDIELVAPGAPAAAPLDRLLRAALPGSSWNDVRRAVRSGKVRVDGAVITEPTLVPASGARVELRMAAPRRETGLLSPGAIVFVDSQVVVVRKPAGISTVPHGEDQETLDRAVHALLRRTAPRGTTVPPLGIVQRLDRETSGLLVMARTTGGKRDLQAQLRAHTMRRRYLAVAEGEVVARTLRSRLVQDRGDGRRGSTDDPALGRESVTHVRPLASLRGATLVECRLETGRTHQIRIHLAEAGHPLLGERVYRSRGAGPGPEAPRVLLHAAALGFRHPRSGEELDFEDPPPEDFQAAVRALTPAGAPGWKTTPGK